MKSGRLVSILNEKSTHFYFVLCEVFLAAEELSSRARTATGCTRHLARSNPHLLLPQSPQSLPLYGLTELECGARVVYL